MMKWFAQSAKGTIEVCGKLQPKQRVTVIVKPSLYYSGVNFDISMTSGYKEAISYKA
jgi:hypothetical protein